MSMTTGTGVMTTFPYGERTPTYIEQLLGWYNDKPPE